MKNKKITIIDETLREGMQYRGIMFSPQQRQTILDFQEKLCVDICQAGYPPAHALESDAVKALVHHKKINKYLIRIAAMGRAILDDAQILVDTGINDLHFHLHIKNDISQTKLDNSLKNLMAVIDFVRKQNPAAVISIAMLDIGRTDDDILKKCVLFLNRHHVDIISLPDTSGIMAPNQIHEKINSLSARSCDTQISIHCHNDMGMASANSVMGILAGGTMLEASALGIGERNGIADLFITGKILRDQGYEINLNIDDITTFKKYYAFVDAIIYEQTCEHLLTCNTPFFGSAVKTHVAGTHARGEYGTASEEQLFLNVLCGKNLVTKYLDMHNISFSEDILDTLTLNIKKKSARCSRCVNLSEIKDLAASLKNR